MKNNSRRFIPEEVYENLPPFLEQIVKDYKDRERDMLLLSTIVVLSSSLPNVYGNYDGDKVYPQLYLMIIAPAASGKGIMNKPRQLVQGIHEKILKDSKEERKNCISESKKDKKVNIEECPELQIKIVPANISSSEFYSYLEKSLHGMLMMESEADTLSQMLNNDWSNYSDVLRKAWHHESLSLSRKTEMEFIEISEPKLSVAISGTPDQLQPLVKNTSNGLFSRFMIYNFDEIAPLKNVFAKRLENKNELFDIAANELFKLYGSLVTRESEIQFSFTETQEERFFENLDLIRTDVINSFSAKFTPNVHRAGIVWFRIAMILTILRNSTKISQASIITPIQEDFLSAYEITKTVLRHSQYTFSILSDNGLSMQDDKLLEGLKSVFTTKEAVNLGDKLGIPERTVYEKLKQLRKKRFIKRVSKGKYAQI